MAPPRDPEGGPARSGDDGAHANHTRRGQQSTQWVAWLNSDAKNHVVAFLGEFIGTTMFLFFAFGAGAAQAVGDPTSSSPLTTHFYGSVAAAISLVVNIWVFYRISGGVFNPAFSLALALVQAITPVRAAVLAIAQFAGAIIASFLVQALFPTPFSAQTTLSNGTSLAQGFWIETLCTAEFTFVLLMLAVEKHRGTFLAAFGIGADLFATLLVAGPFTGASINPARSFGPAVAVGQIPSEHWIYWVGPLLGATLAVGVYKLFQLLEFELTNPGQDGDQSNDPTKNPDHRLAERVEEIRTWKEDHENSSRGIFLP